MRARGFTLIEMLIALVIISVAFAAVIFSINQNVRTLTYLQRKMVAGWVAEDVITRAQIGLLRANTGNETMLNKRMHWRIDTRKTENASVMEMRITVKDDQGEGNLVTMTAYRGGTGG